MRDRHPNARDGLAVPHDVERREQLLHRATVTEHREREHLDQQILDALRSAKRARLVEGDRVPSLLVQDAEPGRHVAPPDLSPAGRAGLAGVMALSD